MKFPGLGRGRFERRVEFSGNELRVSRPVAKRIRYLSIPWPVWHFTQGDILESKVEREIKKRVWRLLEERERVVKETLVETNVYVVGKDGKVIRVHELPYVVEGDKLRIYTPGGVVEAKLVDEVDLNYLASEIARDIKKTRNILAVYDDRGYRRGLAGWFEIEDIREEVFREAEKEIEKYFLKSTAEGIEFDLRMNGYECREEGEYMVCESELKRHGTEELVSKVVVKIRRY